MNIDTTDNKTVTEVFSRFHLPKSQSHKGQNGRVLIIGGSSLFHAASIWAAEVASHFVDIVHYSSTKENNKIVTSLKKQFTNGIIVSRDHLESYVQEDDAILLGPGMVRANVEMKKKEAMDFSEIINIKDEGEYTYYLTKYLIDRFPEKKFVFDAGALQMMDPAWLTLLKTPAVITPHQIEFERLFNISLKDVSMEKKIELVSETAKKYRVTILLKTVIDIISDGTESYVVEGGNQGLTKGGTGDTLAGLVVSFLTKEKQLLSALYASIVLKRTADMLLKEKGYWYNISDIIQHIPVTMKDVTKNRV